LDFYSFFVLSKKVVSHDTSQDEALKEGFSGAPNPGVVVEKIALITGAAGGLGRAWQANWRPKAGG
jgi:hypothetical protein